MNLERPNKVQDSKKQKFGRLGYSVYFKRIRYDECLRYITDNCIINKQTVFLLYSQLIILFFSNNSVFIFSVISIANISLQYGFGASVLGIERSISYNSVGKAFLTICFGVEIKLGFLLSKCFFAPKRSSTLVPTYLSNC